MNILPKKSWHVRNRDNIEKVKKDEAKAAEEEKKQLVRAALAEREARTKLLRDRAQSKGAISFVGSEVVPVVNDPSQSHVNFFTDLEKQTKKGNKDYEAEKKAEQEAWEKKVGILTHLGQSVTQGQIKTLVDGQRVPLPEVDPDTKKKESMDPLSMMRKYIGQDLVGKNQASRKRIHEKTEESTSKAQATSKVAYQSHISRSHHHHSRSKKSKPEKRDGRKKHKRKHKHRELVSHSSIDVEQLRAERVKREKAERKRTEQLLSGKSEKTTDEVGLTDARDGRYNSQFHPHLARQRLNYDMILK